MEMRSGTTVLLHHRITVSKSSSGGTVPSALSTVKAFMKNLTVINQKNMFVFQVQDGTVYYCKMQEETKRPESCGRRSSILADAELMHSKDANQRCHETDAKLYLKWHGVHPPTEQQLIDLEELKFGIEKKLDDTVLEYITLMLCRNTHFKLTAADVCLIQPREVDSDGITVPIFPDETISIAVSSKLSRSMPALLYYIHQHLLLFLSIPRYTSSNADHFLPVCLRSGEKMKSQMGSSALYLYAESTKKGKKGHGIACISLDHIAQTSIKNNQASHGYVEVLADHLEELAKVSLVDPKMCDESKIIISVCIWKRGSFNSNALHEKLEIAVQHAVCDAITEMYLELPLTPTYDLKTKAMKSLFNGNEKEDFRFLQSFFQSKFGSGTTRPAKKEVHDEIGNISAGTSLNQFYGKVLSVWLKHMFDVRCPSILHCSIECQINLNKEQVVHNMCKILSSVLRSSKLLKFSRPLNADEDWIYMNTEGNEDCNPGNCMQYVIISRNFDLSKKSNRSSSSSNKLQASWVSVQKFLPHDITLKLDASPCPQQDMMMSSSYIPRQHFVYITSKTDSFEVYFYNIVNDKAHVAFQQLKQCLKFHTARLNMLEGLKTFLDQRT